MPGHVVAVWFVAMLTAATEGFGFYASHSCTDLSPEQGRCSISDSFLIVWCSHPNKAGNEKKIGGRLTAAPKQGKTCLTKILRNYM